MAGLFSILNVGTSGMSAQQIAIQTTSHNISNANTDGYSKQRATMETRTPYGMPSINNYSGPGQIGTGVNVSSIQRLRDVFLDYQVRTQKSLIGKYDVRQNYLGQVESILCEPSTTGLRTTLGNFFSAWQSLSKQPQDSDARTVVYEQSESLVTEINTDYGQLNKMVNDIQSQMGNDVFQINTDLNLLDNLNQQIVSVKSSGMEPNDLLDTRDSLIDKLSSKFGINVTRTGNYGETISAEDVPSANVGTFVKTEDHANGVNRLSYISDVEATYKADGSVNTCSITYYKNGNQTDPSCKVTLNLSGVTTKTQVDELQRNRVLWADSTGTLVNSSGTAIAGAGVSGSTVALSDIQAFKPTAGEFNGYVTTQDEIKDYISQLNKFARGLAYSVNAVHTGDTDSTKDATNSALPFFVNSSTPNSSSGEDSINAGNIAINSDIAADVMKINAQSSKDAGESEGKRALEIADLANKLMQIEGIGSTINTRADLFDPAKGKNTLTDPAGGTNTYVFGSYVGGRTLDNYFRDTINKLGVSSSEAQTMVSNQNKQLNQISQDRDQVSGVSVDEEVANLIQFNHAYQANAKVISTVDQLLDVVINQLKK